MCVPKRSNQCIQGGKNVINFLFIARFVTVSLIMELNSPADLNNLTTPGPVIHYTSVH